MTAKTSHNTTKSSKVSRLGKVLGELERLDREWVVKGVPEAYKMIWVPKNEVRLWSVPRTTGQLLRTLVLAHKPKTILELGTSAGYSTLWLASAAAQYGGAIHTVEATQPKIDMARTYFERSGLSAAIHQIHGMAADVLRDWKAPIDFFFLDADKENYLAYLKAIEKQLRPGALIVADNATDFGPLMTDFLSYLRTNKRYESELIELDHGVFVAVKL